METCFLCRKHKGQEAAPPGGYILEDQHWMICHAQPHMGPLGTLFIESKRHFLDYAEMTDEEAASFGYIIKRIYRALRMHIAAERIYQVTLMDGVPHFHCWLVPRREDDTDKGMKFLARDESCSEAEAVELTNKLREVIKAEHR